MIPSPTDNTQRQSCTLFIVRHGATEWNANGLIQGHQDIPLSATGQQQAQELAQRLEGVPIKAVYSSDLQRAHQTASTLAQGYDISVQATKQLRERYWGRWEGKKFKEVKSNYPALWQHHMDGGPLTDEASAHEDFNEIESYDATAQRVLPFLQQLGFSHPGEQVLVVSHGGVMQALLRHFDPTLDEVPYINSTAFIQLLTDGDRFTVESTTGIGARAVAAV